MSAQGDNQEERQPPVRVSSPLRRRTITVATPLDDRVRHEMRVTQRTYSGIVARALRLYYQGEVAHG